MNDLQSMLKEDNGNVSSMRFVFLFSVLTVMCVWAGANIINIINVIKNGGIVGELSTIPAGVLTFLGVVTGIKAGQKPFESKEK